MATRPVHRSSSGRGVDDPVRLAGLVGEVLLGL
jgi:hypothetical protein